MSVGSGLLVMERRRRSRERERKERDGCRMTNHGLRVRISDEEHTRYIRHTHSKEGTSIYMRGDVDNSTYRFGLVLTSSRSDDVDFTSDLGENSMSHRQHPSP